MFLALRRAFLAGRRDGRLKSSNKRRRTVLALALQPVSAEITNDDNVGFLIAARCIFLSLPADVIRGLPDRFLGVELCFSL